MEKKNPDLKHINSLTKLMDSRFKVPGTSFRFGLDPILGLIPGIGDLISYGISGIIIFYVHRYGASSKVKIKMLLNAALDALIGSIPIVGQIFDFTYKANERNLKLLQEHYEEGKHVGSGKGYIITLLLIFLGLFILLIYAAFQLFEWVIGLF